jgi:hypothetical protein
MTVVKGSTPSHKLHGMRASQTNDGAMTGKPAHNSTSAPAGSAFARTLTTREATNSIISRMQAMREIERNPLWIGSNWND